MQKEILKKSRNVGNPKLKNVTVQFETQVKQQLRELKRQLENWKIYLQTQSQKDKEMGNIKWRLRNLKEGIEIQEKRMFRQYDGKFPQNYEKCPNMVFSKQNNYKQIYAQNHYSEIRLPRQYFEITQRKKANCL